MLKNIHISGKPRFPVEKEEALLFTAKRRVLADKIIRMSADVNEFRKKVDPVFLRERFPEHRGFFHRLRKAEQWAADVGSAVPPTQDFSAWEEEYSELCKMREAFCDDEPVIWEAEKQRRWGVFFRVLDWLHKVVIAAFALG